MNGWLVFFAFPISTIILSITMEKIIKCPILVSSVFFAVYLIVAFAVFNAFFIIYAFVYAIFAYITAIMTRMVIRFIESNNINALSLLTNNKCKSENNSTAPINTGIATNIRVRVSPRNHYCNRNCRYR